MDENMCRRRAWRRVLALAVGWAVILGAVGPGAAEAAAPLGPWRPEQMALAGARIAWQVHLPMGYTTSIKSYHLVDGYLYGLGTDGYVRAIRADTGEYVWTQKLAEPDIAEPGDLRRALLIVLGSPNVASREYIYRFYDTEVQGNSVIRSGEADAGVIAPLLEEGSTVGVALSTDGNPFYGRISPYWAGAQAVAEAMRNVAAVGAVPSGLTDCLNFGNPEKPEAFWQS